MRRDLLQGIDLEAKNRKGVAIWATAFCSDASVLQELREIAQVSVF